MSRWLLCLSLPLFVAVTKVSAQQAPYQAPHVWLNHDMVLKHYEADKNPNILTDKGPGLLEELHKSLSSDTDAKWLLWSLDKDSKPTPVSFMDLERDKLHRMIDESQKKGLDELQM